jgi:hypothetical protein
MSEVEKIAVVSLQETKTAVPERVGDEAHEVTVPLPELIETQPLDGDDLDAPTVAPPLVPEQSPEAGVGSSPMLQSAELQYHHYANIFPLLDGDEDEALVDSIAKSGIREPIVLHEDKILDGRNRYRAARKLNLPITKIPIRKFDPEREGDPIDWFVSRICG